MAKKQAKITGKLLASYLAQINPRKTVSLISFSLGSEVIKSCIKTLKYMGQFDIIQNVTFLAGTSTFTESEQEIFENVVNGDIKNVYSKNDKILSLYFGSS